MGLVMVPTESRADVSARGIWKRRTTAMFGILIMNINTGSYLCMTLKNDLANAEKDKKNKCVQASWSAGVILIPWLTLRTKLPKQSA